MSKGYFSTTDGHQLYYETYGNPSGIPILFLHGGPGAGFSERDKDFFDLNHFFVLFFEQRGTGRSLPQGSLKDNTTAHLVEDINRILDFFKLETVWLFGGSWGSTLALIYAIQFPTRVLGMILRGVFLASQKEEYFHEGHVKMFVPEAWERFIQIVPPEEQHNIIAYYFEKMQDPDPNISKHFVYEWTYFGTQVYLPTTSLDIIKADLAEVDLYFHKALLGAHYSHHRCFLPDNYILNNTVAIQNIPTTIVHGRYDIMCPPKFAYDLYQQLNHANLHLVDAGHGAHEPVIKKQLQLAVNQIITK